MSECTNVYYARNSVTGTSIRADKVQTPLTHAPYLPAISLGLNKRDPTYFVMTDVELASSSLQMSDFSLPWTARAA